MLIVIITAYKNNLFTIKFYDVMTKLCVILKLFTWDNINYITVMLIIKLNMLFLVLVL